ncbi:MAG: type II toxin-antitoxin system RelE/ParE family toxin [Firmicutes bacterium]|nr:type II toxin-antitoxin system RelE/ParE family toxin [Bacillota bacterium]MBQ4092690.1 type II toxin-antitoxin system RelE/ParE family toxin [Bacillota bacterium]MBQ6810908.1 type II toxin-antitoxin system RelE/ParE family toxin [Bacillota bacterium]
MSKIRLTPKAFQDLKEIKTYIAVELQNPQAAMGIVSKITKSLKILEEHPLAGPSVEAKTGFSSDLRILVCAQYIAIYRVENDFISVARIINAKQDYIRILFGEQE